MWVVLGGARRRFGLSRKISRNLLGQNPWQSGGVSLNESRVRALKFINCPMRGGRMNTKIRSFESEYNFGRKGFKTEACSTFVAECFQS
jgi:hypothetical protein